MADDQLPGLPELTWTEAELAELAARPVLHSCPRAPPHLPRPHEWAANSDGLCHEFSCSFCPDAGFVWTSGFCVRGHWKKKRLEAVTLDPSVWSELPLQLLEPIFARLSTDGIGRVRALSNNWKQATLTSASTFTEECAKWQPKLCALMGFRETCWVRAYDTDACKWHAFSIESIPKLYASSIRACDGGLACFVPCCRVDRQPVLVCNPLTRECRPLPLQRRELYKLGMVQLRVDRDSGSYKVILLEHTGFGIGGVNVEVYDSETEEWSELLSGTVFGGVFSWSSSFSIAAITYGVYDCSTDHLHKVDEDLFRGRPVRDSYDAISTEWKVKMLANHNNDLYILEECELQPARAFSEDGLSTILYNVLKYVEGQLGFGSNGLPEFVGDPAIFEFDMDKLCSSATLLVCKTFFLSLSPFFRGHGGYHLKLYDMENKKWAEDFYLECSDEWHSLSRQDLETGAFICELRWDACP